MNPSPPIVAGVDFSSSSGQVLAHAAKLAEVGGSKLVAVHVIGASTIKEWEDSMGREATTAGRIEEMRQRLEELLAEHCPGLAAETVVRVGKAHQVLADVLREQNAQLLVLGAHDVAKRRLGSVAARCARTAPADVLLLRDWQTRLFRRVAACLDLSKSSEQVLQRAIAVAAAHGASMEILHVYFPPGRDPWGRVMEQPMDSTMSYEARVRERARCRMDEFLKPYADSLAGIESSVLFLEAESPAAVITAHVAAVDTDLTVIGSREGEWLENLVLGSNAERLLHDSSSSVLITRA